MQLCMALLATIQITIYHNNWNRILIYCTFQITLKSNTFIFLLFKIPEWMRCRIQRAYCITAISISNNFDQTVVYFIATGWWNARMNRSEQIESRKEIVLKLMILPIFEIEDLYYTKDSHDIKMARLLLSQRYSFLHTEFIINLLTEKFSVQSIQHENASQTILCSLKLLYLIKTIVVSFQWFTLYTVNVSQSIRFHNTHIQTHTNIHCYEVYLYNKRKNV